MHNAYNAIQREIYLQSFDNGFLNIQKQVWLKNHTCK